MNARPTPARPTKDEAAPYYFTYIDQVTGNDGLAAVREQLEPAVKFLAGISEEKSVHRYAPGKWTLRQLLNHVTDTERAFLFRGLWFARGFTAALPSFDQDVAVAGADADSICWAAHVEEFRRVRLASIAFFENLSADAWSRSGIASDKRFTVRALAFITAGHVEHHLRIVREKYL
jgi:hypothetical protein